MWPRGSSAQVSATTESFKFHEIVVVVVSDHDMCLRGVQIVEKLQDP